jgi:carbamoyltransferase
MYTLGINSAFHDSSACLVRDGRVFAAAEEERFTRIKHAKRPVPFSAWELPFHAIDYCLAEANLELIDVAHVAYALDPSLLPGTGRAGAAIALPLEPSAEPARPPEPGASPWEPLFLAYVVNAPRPLAGGAPHHLARRFRGARPDGPYRWHFVEHHAAHEASAYLAAPFERMAVMTLDGRGERATTTFGLYRDGKYRRLKQVDYPHSLGLLYEDVTRHLGFLHSSDEYKVMALAASASRATSRLSAQCCAWMAKAGTRWRTPASPSCSDRRARAASRSKRGTATSPPRCRPSWSRPFWSSPPGCGRRAAKRTWRWPAAWRSTA